MKSSLLFLLFNLALQVASAQWSGVLTYTDNYESGSDLSGKTITIISESGGKGRIDSKTYPTKSPTNDLSEKDQNVLIYDFSKQQKTILIAKMNMATTQSMAAEDQRNEQVMLMQGGTFQIENL